MGFNLNSGNNFAIPSNFRFSFCFTISCRPLIINIPSKIIVIQRGKKNLYLEYQIPNASRSILWYGMPIKNVYLFSFTNEENPNYFPRKMTPRIQNINHIKNINKKMINDKWLIFRRILKIKTKISTNFSSKN